MHPNDHYSHYTQHQAVSHHETTGANGYPQAFQQSYDQHSHYNRVSPTSSQYYDPVDDVGDENMLED